MQRLGKDSGFQKCHFRKNSIRVFCMASRSLQKFDAFFDVPAKVFRQSASPLVPLPLINFHKVAPKTPSAFFKDVICCRESVGLGRREQITHGENVANQGFFPAYWVSFAEGGVCPTGADALVGAKVSGLSRLHFWVSVGCWRMFVSDDASVLK